ncbi:MAG: SMI1/KNR4 family protein [Bacteroidia bacterium]
MQNHLSLFLIFLLFTAELYGQSAQTTKMQPIMRKMLQEISAKAILLNEYDFSQAQIDAAWLGTTPANEKEIDLIQNKLGVKLPDDYISFLSITDGFPQYYSTTVTFLPIKKIDYLRNIDNDLIEMWGEAKELKDISDALQRSILVGGINEEQYFLLIPPKTEKGKWKYWLFASWIPGESEFENLEAYFRQKLTALQEETEGLTKPKSKLVPNYSLRNQVFNGEWEQAFETAYHFLSNGETHGYYNQIDLWAIMLLAASKLNNHEMFLQRIAALKNQKEKSVNLDDENSKYQFESFQNRYTTYVLAAQNKLAYVDIFQFYTFIPQLSPITLEEIEAQIKTYRKELLKPKYLPEKIDYQLYFLFDGGNEPAFIEIYETNRSIVSFESHFKAAIVYAYNNQSEKAKQALEKYFETAFIFQPLKPFLSEGLSKVMDKEFSQQMLLKYAK